MLYKFNIGWLVEEMDQQLFHIGTINCQQQDVSDVIPQYDIIIYYRMSDFENTGIFTAKQLDKLTGFIIDDFLLDDIIFGAGIRSFMENVDFIVTPTAILRDLYFESGIHKKFFVKIDGLPLKQLLSLKQSRLHKVNDRFKVGWLGGASHEVYVDLYEQMLQYLSNQEVELTFVCFGKPRSFQERVEKLPHILIENHTFIPFNNERDYYSTIANLGLDTVVNMVAHTRLSMGKAELKFIETGLYKIPLITSNWGIWREVIWHGRNGLLAKTPEEFGEMVILLKNDPELRKRIARTAFKEVMQYYDIEMRAKEFEAFLYHVYERK